MRALKTGILLWALFAAIPSFANPALTNAPAQSCTPQSKPAKVSGQMQLFGDLTAAQQDAVIANSLKNCTITPDEAKGLKSNQGSATWHNLVVVGGTIISIAESAVIHNEMINKTVGAVKLAVSGHDSYNNISNCPPPSDPNQISTPSMPELEDMSPLVQTSIVNDSIAFGAITQAEGDAIEAGKLIPKVLRIGGQVMEVGGKVIVVGGIALAVVNTGYSGYKTYKADRADGATRGRATLNALGAATCTAVDNVVFYMCSIGKELTNAPKNVDTALNVLANSPDMQDTWLGQQAQAQQNAQTQAKRAGVVQMCRVMYPEADCDYYYTHDPPADYVAQ